MSKLKCEPTLAAKLALAAGWAAVRVQDGFTSLTVVAPDGTKIVMPNTLSNVNANVFSSWIRKIRRHGPNKINSIELGELLHAYKATAATAAIVMKAWGTEEPEAPTITPDNEVVKRVVFSDICEVITYKDGHMEWACRYAGCDFKSNKGVLSVAAHTKRHIRDARRAQEAAQAEAQTENQTEDVPQHGPEAYAAKALGPDYDNTETPLKDRCEECGFIEGKHHDSCSKHVEPNETQYPNGMTHEQVWRLPEKADPPMVLIDRIKDLLDVLGRWVSDNDIVAERDAYKARAENAESSLAALRDMLNEAVTR